jgi:hypothetical protein
MDAIILKEKVRYIDPIAICEARHARPKWMKDDDDYLNVYHQAVGIFGLDLFI